MQKVRWAMLYGFVANFICFPAMQKCYKNRLRFDKVAEFEGGNIFETQRRLVKYRYFLASCLY